MRSYELIKMSTVTFSGKCVLNLAFSSKKNMFEVTQSQFWLNFESIENTENSQKWPFSLFGMVPVAGL